MTRAPIIAALILIAALMLLPALVLGQEYGKGPNLHDHDWIMQNPKYTMSPGGIHCCDPSHCRPLAPGDAVKIGDAWLYKPTGQVFKRGDNGVYPSERWQAYGCGWETLWCFFYPPEGM